MINYCEGAEELFGWSIDKIGLSSSDSLENLVIEAGALNKSS